MIKKATLLIFLVFAFITVIHAKEVKPVQPTFQKSTENCKVPNNDEVYDAVSVLGFLTSLVSIVFVLLGFPLVALSLALVAGILSLWGLKRIKSRKLKVRFLDYFSLIYFFLNILMYLLAIILLFLTLGA